MDNVWESRHRTCSVSENRDSERTDYCSVSEKSRHRSCFGVREIPFLNTEERFQHWSKNHNARECFAREGKGFWSAFSLAREVWRAFSLARERRLISRLPLSLMREKPDQWLLEITKQPLSRGGSLAFTLPLISVQDADNGGSGFPSLVARAWRFCTWCLPYKKSNLLPQNHFARQSNQEHCRALKKKICWRLEAVETLEKYLGINAWKSNER